MEEKEVREYQKFILNSSANMVYKAMNGTTLEMKLYSRQAPKLMQLMAEIVGLTQKPDIEHQTNIMIEQSQQENIQLKDQVKTLTSLAELNNIEIEKYEQFKKIESDKSQ